MPWHARCVAPENPERWASTVVLGDGDTVLIRPITPDDRDALTQFHERQSRDSQYRRYFTAKPRLSSSELDHFTRVDFVDRVALVVEAHGEFIAWASYERWPNRDDADSAFMVDDRHHGRGIATLLLEHLAAIARSNGITRFTAEVLAENRAMLSVFSRAGWPLQRRFESGVIDLDFELADTSEFLDSVERREQRADSRAISRLLLPRSIAVIGASDTENTVGHVLWRNATRGFSGPLYPVNPNHATIGGQPAYATIGDVPDDVTVAVVAVRADQLESVLDQCIAKRVRGAVIVTEVGDTVDMGAIVTRARRNGLRLIGPASMGIASPLPSTLIQAAIVDADLPAGGVAISMQSGTLGSSLLALAHRLDMGVSWFVSLGDRSDVSADDLLQFWEDDDATKVIALYTESHGNPHKFARIARRVSQRRPIVAVRTGTALVGQASEALYQQAGVIEVPTVAALLDTARVMACQPLMAGPAVAVVTNSRSPGVLAAAAVEAAELHTVEPPFPLDWTSNDEDYERAVRAALESDDVDAVLVIHAPAVASAIGGPIDHIDRAAAGATKPVVAVMLGARRRSVASGIGCTDVRISRTGRRRPRPTPCVLAVALRRGGRGRRVAGRHRRGGRCPSDRRRHRCRSRSPLAGGDPLRARPLRRGDGGRPAGAFRRSRRDGRHDRLPDRRQGGAPSAGTFGAGGRRARSRPRRRRPPCRGRDARTPR